MGHPIYTSFLPEVYLTIISFPSSIRATYAPPAARYVLSITRAARSNIPQTEKLVATLDTTILRKMSVLLSYRQVVDAGLLYSTLLYIGCTMSFFTKNVIFVVIHARTRSRYSTVYTTLKGQNWSHHVLFACGSQRS
jgi:hypothetical protein